VPVGIDDGAMLSLVRQCHGSLLHSAVESRVRLDHVNAKQKASDASEAGVGNYACVTWTSWSLSLTSPEINVAKGPYWYRNYSKGLEL